MDEVWPRPLWNQSISVASMPKRTVGRTLVTLSASESTWFSANGLV
jgi:hypothetical protein